MSLRGGGLGGILLAMVAILAATAAPRVAGHAIATEAPPAPQEPADEAPAPPAAADADAADSGSANDGDPEANDGDGSGQADLDAAIDAKMSARSLDDFARVLELCKKALDKGLDAEGRQFADKLYTGTLVDRAAMLVDVIYETAGRDPNWPRLRAFAMRDLEEIVERNPDLGQGHLMIARLEALPQGDTERAASAARRALELLGDDKLQKARAHVVLAGVADEAGERREHFDAAVELSPRDAEIRRARGLFHLVEDDFAAAREDLGVAIEESPGDAGLYEALGMACAMDEKFEEARQAFGRAVELAPRASSPLLQRARLEAVEGKFGEALADLDRAVEVAPDDPATRLLRARIRMQNDDDDGAREDVAEVLRRHPDNPAGLELRAIMATADEDFPAAIRDFRRLVAQRPDDADLLCQLGLIYLAADQPRKAIERFTRALELDDEHFSSRRGRSDALISIGEHERAIADLEVALTLRPDDNGVLNNLAWLLATSPVDELRDGERAVELATKACESTQWRQAHIISTLAAGFAEQGDFETAKKYSRQAVETGGVTDEIEQQLRGELESYEAGKPVRERQTMEDAEFDDPPGLELEKADPKEPVTAAVDAGRGDEAGQADRAAEADQADQPHAPRRPFDAD